MPQSSRVGLTDLQAVFRVWRHCSVAPPSLLLGTRTLFPLFPDRTSGGRRPVVVGTPGTAIRIWTPARPHKRSSNALLLSVKRLRTSDIQTGALHHVVVRHSAPGRVSRRFAINAQGQDSDVAKMHSRFVAQHQLRFGTLTLPAAQRLLESPNEQHDLMVFFSQEWSAAEVRASISKMKLRSPADVGEDPWVVLARVDSDEALALARQPWAQRTLAFQPDTESVAFGVPNAEEIPDNAATTNSDTSFTHRAPIEADNIYGRNVKVGLVELGPNCGIWAKEDAAGSIVGHEAFSSLSGIDYFIPPATCTIDADCSSGLAAFGMTPSANCDTAAPIFSGQGRCRSGICVDPDATFVASRIASHSECGTTAGDALRPKPVIIMRLAPTFTWRTTCPPTIRRYFETSTIGSFKKTYTSSTNLGLREGHFPA